MVQESKRGKTKVEHYPRIPDSNLFRRRIRSYQNPTPLPVFTAPRYVRGRSNIPNIQDRVGPRLKNRTRSGVSIFDELRVFFKGLSKFTNALCLTILTERINDSSNQQH